jgi:hypothetical protein
MEKETTYITEKIFKTKTGFCHVLPDKIVLSRDGILGNVAAVTVGNNISRILVLQGIIALGLIYAAFESYQHPTLFNRSRPIIFGLLAIYLIYNILKSSRNSATPVIDRQKIKEVKFKKAIEGLTRSRFEVFFETEKGSIKKRLILLPGSIMDNLQTETDKALQIMTEEGILKAQD